MLSSRRSFPILLLITGMGLLLLSFAVDFVGLSGPGFSTKQIQTLLLGTAVSAAGFALWTPVGQRLLSRMGNREDEGLFTRARVTRLIVISAWFGLIAGMGEGLGFFVLQRFGVSTEAWTEIVWISTLVDTLLFVTLGLVLAALWSLWKSLPITLISIWLFSFMAFFSWTQLTVTGLGIHPVATLFLAIGLAVVFTQQITRRRAFVISFWYKSLPYVAALAVVTLIVVESGIWVQERIATLRIAEASTDFPSVLFIVVDTLRSDHLSSYGYKRDTSPNIDRLAGEGVLFERAYSTASYTLPSHVSLFTGSYQHSNGITWTNAREYSNYPGPVLAESLHKRGYRTAAFSGNTYWISRPRGFGRGFVHFEDFFHTPVDMALRTVYGRRLSNVIPSRMFKEARRKWSDQINLSVMNWLKRDQKRPFFVFINYLDVHAPYLPPEPFRSKYSGPAQVGGILDEQLGEKSSNLNAEQIQSEIDAYDGAISFVDEQIGLLMSKIQDAGMADDLLVIITSDHGEAFGEHGVFQHANSLYREEVQVPLIIWQPDRIPPGVRIRQVVSNASIPTTILDLIGEGDTAEFPRQSLSHLWNSTDLALSWPDTLMETESVPWSEPQAPLRQGSMISVVNNDWHYIEHEKFGAGLYDINSDPMEFHDLSESPEGQTVIGMLKRSLDATLASSP